MDFVYPKSPDNVPADLTKPTLSYRKHAWLAVMGLLLFVVVYFFLAGWFCWSAWQIIAETHRSEREILIGYLFGGCSAFLGLFMLKALFFIKHSAPNNGIEVTQATEPALFKFLNTLADEAGAPRPHRVFLSHSVNACVFYDLSVLNFFFSSKKNLEIGLPLINSLTLGELKAVLAHEFGHFAQKSMSVGHWVYIAHQVAAHIIAKRDWLDDILKGLSNIDLRVAWIGWLMQLIVWSIRSLMQALFFVALLADRALSREMEFQADLVAVSLTGSDALVHALHKLPAADDAWSRTLDFVGSEVSAGRAVDNLFIIQSAILDKMRVILDDDSYGATPSVPNDHPESYRVFKGRLGNPPKMWATHPENTEREENAKRVYVAADVDASSAWGVFNAPQQLQSEATKHLLRDEDLSPNQLEQTLKTLDQRYSARSLDPNYKGSYLGRDLTRHVENAHLLYDDTLALDIHQIKEQLYPSTLKQQLQSLRDSQTELAALDALKSGSLKAQGGIIRHNGEEYKRQELDDVIRQQSDEVSTFEASVHAHDKVCRSAHIQLANELNEEYANYLKGLIGVLHYAEHSLAEVTDVQGLLNNTISVVLADGQVSSQELKRVINTGTEVYNVLRGIYGQAGMLKLDDNLLERLSIQSWKDAMGTYTLAIPDKHNINDWMGVIYEWFDATINALSALRRETLEQLLESESRVMQAYDSGDSLTMAHGISSAPAGYTRLIPGSERKLQTKLNLWDRFHTADGFLGSFLRYSLATLIVGSTLWYGLFMVWHS